MSINWNNIRPLQNSQNEGFEEFVCQLARKEKIPNATRFIRKGKPDGGVECFWILNNQNEWAWQAKFFTNSLTATQWGEIDRSVKTVIDKHPNIKKYIIAMPIDPADARIEGQNSMLAKWNSRVVKWAKWANEKRMQVEFIPWWSSDLIERLQKPENMGLTYFWFNKEEFTDEWCKEQTELSIADLGKRYTPNFNPELNVALDIANIFNGLSKNTGFLSQINSLFNELLTVGNKTLSVIKTSNNKSEKFKNQLSEIHSLYTRVSFQGTEFIPADDFIRVFEALTYFHNSSLTICKLNK